MTEILNDGVQTEPFIRVMALHALAYCERLFYLEEVEELRVADASVYAGRRLHEELPGGDEGEWVSYVLESETLGLKGRADCLRRRDGVLVPYEHKRGRAARGPDGGEAWPSDRLQVIAYALLVEEHTRSIVPEARIRYHVDNLTVRIPIDAKAREDIFQAIQRARTLRRTVERPAVTDNDRLCVRCSLAPVCLPEEERVVAQPSFKPVRLFPPEDEREVLHVLEPGSRVTRAGHGLVVVKTNGTKESFPIRRVGQVVLHGHAQITTQAIHLCAHQEVGVHWITTGGRYVGGLSIGAGGVQRRIRQYEALREPSLCIRLARKLAAAKVEGQLRFLLRASRDKDRQASGIGDLLRAIRLSLSEVSRAESVESLRGHEGNAGRNYFKGLSSLVRPDVDERLQFDGRNRRPPRDCFNALLSFGYALLYRDIVHSISSVGLDPAIGFFHQPRSAAYPLALDLMELFRVPLWDIPLMGSINRLQWDPRRDFTFSGAQVWLTDHGRTTAIEIYERRKMDRWKHPVTRYSLSYSRLIELEVRLLEKEWMSSGGLFARMRLR